MLSESFRFRIVKLVVASFSRSQAKYRIMDG